MPCPDCDGLPERVAELQEQLGALRTENAEMAMVLDGQGWKRVGPGHWERQEATAANPASRAEA